MSGNIELTKQRLRRVLVGSQDNLASDSLGAILSLSAHQELLIAALNRAYKEVLNERDCLYESSSRPDTGEVTDENDRKALADRRRPGDIRQTASRVQQGRTDRHRRRRLVRRNHGPPGPTGSRRPT